MSTLQVSIIEGRNLALPEGAGDPYVKLQFQGQEVQTSGVKGMSTQAGVMFKWLKDFKLHAPQPGGELEVSVRTGKMILGSIKISVESIGDSGTKVDWHKIVDEKGGVKGEVCLVLRTLKKGSITPGRAGASPKRPERQRSPGRSGSPARTSISRAGPDGGAASATPPPSASIFPGNKGSPPPLPMNPAAMGGTSPRDRSASLGSPRRASTQSPRRHRASLEGKAKRPPKEKKPPGEGGGGGILQKLPIVGAVIGVLGLLTLVAGRPKYYEIQEGDTFCAVGICFNRNVKNLISKNPQVVDPNKLFPGDRIRID